MQEEQKGACSTISASQLLLLIFDQSESVSLLLHRSHLSWEIDPLTGNLIRTESFEESTYDSTTFSQLIANLSGEKSSMIISSSQDGKQPNEGLSQVEPVSPQPDDPIIEEQQWMVQQWQEVITPPPHEEEVIIISDDEDWLLASPSPPRPASPQWLPPKRPRVVSPLDESFPLIMPRSRHNPPPRDCIRGRWDFPAAFTPRLESYPFPCRLDRLPDEMVILILKKVTFTGLICLVLAYPESRAALQLCRDRILLRSLPRFNIPEARQLLIANSMNGPLFEFMRNIRGVIPCDDGWCICILWNDLFGFRFTPRLECPALKRRK